MNLHEAISLRPTGTQTGGRCQFQLYCVLLCSLLFGSLPGRASPPPAGVAPVISPAGGFSIDGDLTANNPITNLGDWVAVTNFNGSGAGVLTPTGIPINPATTFHFIDPYNGKDSIFSGGLKWTDNPNLWTWTTSKPSSKTDINNVLLHIATDADGHIWVIVAADRFSTSGDSYIDFEFLQNTLTRNSNGTFTSAGPNGGRTTNDMLLSLAFTGGGKVADFFAWQWQADGLGGFVYNDVTTSLPAGRVFVALNSNSVAVPYGAFGSTTYGPNAFAEAAVDLTALLGNFDQCLSFGFKTIMVKTKASSSSTAGIEDFIDPIQYKLKIGPSADAGPDQTRCVEGPQTVFPLNGIATAGLQPIVSTAWSVLSGDATIGDPSSLVTTAVVSSASATLRLTVVQTNGCTETDDVVLHVAPLPTCSIAGPSLVCPAGLTQFQAPPGMSNYFWSIAGNGTISGATNAQNVNVRAGSACDQPYTLSLLVISNGCSSTCSTPVLVQDTTAPTINCPADRVLECPADTRTNNTGIATAQDNCGQVAISYSDAITNLCGGTKVIYRTWIATDLCGNSTDCLQTITVRDTVNPTITCPPNRTLDCPADTSTNNTGVATATDGCGAVAIGYSDSVSNSCGGAKVISRLWSAVDACGNSASCVQTITVRDITPPVITCPSNVVLECPANTSTNNTGIATATDTCGQVSIRYTDAVTNSCGGARVIARTWTATDECGNASSCVQTITVRDTVPPTLTLPANLTLECPAVTTTNNTGVATAQDGCGSVTVTFTDSVTNYCGGTKVILRNWRATDSCGNSTNAIQTITVRDLTPPTLTLPADVVLECPTINTSTNYTGTATALDGCGSVTVTYSDVVTTNCGNTKVIARTWTATDQCGNTTRGLQTITIRDTIKPTLVVPADLTLECPAVTTTNNTGTATAQDGCGAVTVTFTDSVSNSCGSTKVISRLWTATDACGNTTNKAQLITVIDTHPPTITAPPNVVLDCPANTTTNNTGVAVAQDGCSTVTIGYSDIVSNGCGGTKVITRTWTATDACGNAASAIQTIAVRDITPPALKLPANVVQQCPGDTRTNVTGTATATDGCGSVTISYSDVVSNGCSFTRTVWRRWTATDQCGNTTNGLQTIAVIDTTKPTILCPNISVQCVADIPPAYASLDAFRASGGTATDACSAGLAFSLISDSGLIGRCPGTVTRVYRVTDDCGNFADGTQKITVDDTIAPVITCPASATVEYGFSLDPTNIGRATATDNCSTNVAITYTDTTVSSVYNINFYAADPDLGTGPYSPTYVKLGPASLPCPTAAMLTGRAQDPLRNAVAFGPTASQLDALTSLGGAPMALGQIVPFEAVIGLSGAPGPERGTIEFTASWATHTTSNDRFGFDTNYMVYCAFVDTGDPGFIDPNTNARVQSVSSTIINQGTIDEQIVGTFRVTGLDIGDQVVVEIWMVLDSTQPQNVGGTIAAQLVSAQKVLSPPEPITVGSKTISIGNLNKMNPLPPPQEQPPLGPPTPQPPVQPGVIISAIDRTWMATDDCGNSRTCVQRITVRDSTPPLLSLPPDLVLDCPADTSTNNTGTATAPDPGGDPVVISYADSVTNGCAATEVISRLWTATDLAGNSTNAVQTITVRDVTPPIIVCPPDLTLSCPGKTTTNRTGVATAQDTCSAIASLTFSDSVSNLCGGSRIVSRTWTAVDACGNAASCVQTITIQDTTPPILTCPPDVVLECPADTSTNNTGIATAVDACGSVTVDYSDVVSQTCIGSKTVARIWTATDGCGNQATCVQSITVQDTTPPRLICPANQTVLAGDAWTFGVPQVSDTCSEFTLQVLNTFTNHTATNTIIATRSWVATDACGNSAQCQQTITVDLGAAPSITSQPQGGSFSYGSSTTLNIEATGTGSLSYQWMFNGAEITGATSTALPLNSMQFSSAGLYCVVVSNAAGTVTSSMAIVNVGASLTAEYNGSIETLTWPPPFILQWATSVTGPYTDVPGATSPYYYDTASGPLRFFRLRTPPFSLTGNNLPGGQFLVNCPGIAGCSLVIQASTNLEAWVNLYTNVSPFTFTDPDAGLYSQRFYRAVLAH